MYVRDQGTMHQKVKATIILEKSISYLKERESERERATVANKKGDNDRLVVMRYKY